jgi:hypothetical protein
MKPYNGLGRHRGCGFSSHHANPDAPASIARKVKKNA